MDDRNNGDYGVSLFLNNWLFNIKGTARTTLRAHGAQHKSNREFITVSHIWKINPQRDIVSTYEGQNHNAKHAWKSLRAKAFW